MASGVLGWPPKEFWNCTLMEFLDASEQWVMTHGSGEEAEKRRYEQFKEELETAGVA